MNNNNNNNNVKAKEAEEMLQMEEIFWQMIKQMPEPTEPSPLLATEDELKENPLAQALIHLDDEADPQEMAEGYKNSGNSKLKMALSETKDARLKKKFFLDAIDFYTKAINEKVSSKTSNSIYYSNRAQVHLFLKNYGKAIDDANSSLSYNPKNIKAIFRATKAYFLLEKYPDVISWAKRGFKIDPTNQPLKELCQELYKKLQSLQKLKEKKQEELNQKQSKEEELERKLEERGIIMGKKLYDAQAIYENQTYFDENNKVHMSAMFLYPQYAQSDFIKDISEEDTLGDHLSYMFPSKILEHDNNEKIEYTLWDEKKEYLFENLALYIEAGCTTALKKSLQKKIKKRYIKVKHTTKLGKIITHPDYAIPQFPVIFVFVQGSKYEKEFLETPFE